MLHAVVQRGMDKQRTTRTLCTRQATSIDKNDISRATDDIS